MNYKRIIKNQKTRFFILRFLKWLPSRLMLQLQYFVKLNRFLNLTNPKRFTEKIQHYKLYYRNETMLICTDKYLVRDFIRLRGQDNYLNNLLGVYKDASEIDFTNLPEKFVIKTTDGGGGENIYICRNKSKLDVQLLINKVNGWRNKGIGNISYEWAYEGDRDSLIIIEDCLEDADTVDNSINDYKFFCFNGKVEYLVVDIDRYSGHKRNFYNKDWLNLNISSDCPNADREIKKPENFDQMIVLAENLAKGFPFVRVDLYNIQGKVFFGEMTFYPWSGYVQFNPDEFDFTLGQKFYINY